MSGSIDSGAPSQPVLPAAALAPTPAGLDSDPAATMAPLLHSICSDAGLPSGPGTAIDDADQQQLVQVRLGVASSLFTALRAKHAQTAAHSLRVALGCSCWALELGLPEEQCEAVEVAGLLHDIGKVGVPDHILLKPSKLTPEESAVMARHVQMGIDILSSCSPSDEVLQIVRYSAAWYDGNQGESELKGAELPFGARLLAIVDAYDSMTTDHIYRPAWSRERALAEMYHFAGSQFDPELVNQFCKLHAKGPFPLNPKVAKHWLETLSPERSNLQWRLGGGRRPQGEPRTPDVLFQHQLLTNMHDGVVFVDSERQILLWNQSAERLTGIAGDAAYRRCFLPSLLELCDERGTVIPDEACPAAHAIESKVQSRRRVSIRRRDGDAVPLELHAIPVVSSDGTAYGATLLLHDVSPETSLEERCQSLHAKAIRDPLTQVANRAEFDRVHRVFIDAHRETNLPCSLIICDIDHFKKVNDQFGHQAGDEAIKAMAGLLNRLSRPGDLVARYGGEEFVVLCADCNNSAGTNRAEEIRRELSQLEQPMLASRHITASFGVTELQAGDTPETMLRRADRALLQAKSMGRNMVVQLGTGLAPERRRKSRWPFFKNPARTLVETNLLTRVPMDVAVEKLRGFIADHNAQVLGSGDDWIELTIEGNYAPRMSRHSDRRFPFIVMVKLSEESTRRTNTQGQLMDDATHAKLNVVIRPKRDRERRRDQATDRARELLASLKAYLVAVDEVPGKDRNALAKATSAIAPMLKRR